MNILALDVGTAAVKAAVLDAETTQPIGQIGRSRLILESPTAEAAQIEAEVLWQAIAKAARSAIVNTDVSRQSIAAIGISAMMPALILLDASDRPIGPVWTHLDRRARPAAREVTGEVAKEFLNTTGNRALPGGISVLSYRQQMSAATDLPRRVRSYLHLNGWLAFHMTGHKFFDRANACFTGLFGTLTDHQWSRRWCDYFQVDPAWLPPVVCGSTTAGTVRPAIAEELGLSANIPVKLGTSDTTSAMLAADMDHEDLLHAVGTRQVLAMRTSRPRASPKRLTRLFGVGDDYIHVAHNPIGGVALDWLRHLCFREQSDREFYEKTLPRAIEHETAVKLDPPYLGGDRLEVDPKRAAFRDLELTTDRLDLLSGLLDSMVDCHYDATRALGHPKDFRRVFLTGAEAELVQALIPEYQTGVVERLEEGSLRGVAKLFAHD